MTKTSSREFVIIYPHMLSLTKLIIAFKNPLKLDFREFAEWPTEFGLRHFGDNWRVILSLFFLRLLDLARFPFMIIGNVIEWTLNFIRLNGGPISVMFRLVTGRLELPKKGTEKYLSIIGMLERRTTLYRREAEVAGSDKIDHPPESPRDKFYIDLCAMCSGLVYENENVIKQRVKDSWKMNFVKFYNLWNDRLRKATTQAFICTDKEEDANLIILTFRGTEPFDADDWATDADLSWYRIPFVGKAHVGFMEGLGIANRFDSEVLGNLDFDYKELDKPLAYHTLVEELHQLMQNHKNARILVTGHSLGGALTVVFAAILIVKNEVEILKRLQGVYTYRQPRVGDEEFGIYVNSTLNNPVPRYYRIVYCNDMVPRVPFDDFVSLQTFWDMSLL